MIILDEPYASPLLVQWCALTQHPVLDTAFARRLTAQEAASLHLVGEAEAIRRIDDGERIYTNSENALAWILDHTHNEVLNDAIRLFKDKAAMRTALAPLAPHLLFQTYSQDELMVLDGSELPLPVVLKPSVGFCSMGVYSIFTLEDWASALEDIAQQQAVWAKRYPDSVVDPGLFIVEGYLRGVEYAIDMYYDSEGHAHCLNIMRHDFADTEDTSDRLYSTSHEIICATEERFTVWLDEVNAIVGARDFPAHVEIRVDEDATIIPIEFNPLRFAGLGGTDIAYWAWGLRTYEAYLNGEVPDLKALSAPFAGKVFTMSLLNPDPKADLSKPFLYDEFAARFSTVLDFHRFDVNAIGSYGFLFLETDASTASELEFLLHSDLLEFQGA